MTGWVERGGPEWLLAISPDKVLKQPIADQTAVNGTQNNISAPEITRRWPLLRWRLPRSNTFDASAIVGRLSRKKGNNTNKPEIISSN